MKLRTTALAAALVAATIPALPTSAMAIPVTATTTIPVTPTDTAILPTVMGMAGIPTRPGTVGTPITGRDRIIGRVTPTVS